MVHGGTGKDAAITFNELVIRSFFGDYSGLLRGTFEKPRASLAESENPYQVQELSPPKAEFYRRGGSKKVERDGMTSSPGGKQCKPRAAAEELRTDVIGEFYCFGS